MKGDGDPQAAAGGSLRAAHGQAGDPPVKGDIHDIGKNLEAMWWRAGLRGGGPGINNAVETDIDTAEREGADIIGMSALLATTMPCMKVVIGTLKEKGRATLAS